MTLLFKVDDTRSHAWKSLFETQAPDIDVRLWPDIGDPAQIHFFASWQPPVEQACTAYVWQTGDMAGPPIEFQSL